MSSTQFNAGQTQGQTQAKTEQMMQSAKESANTAQNKAGGAADQTAGFFQETSEQVKSMAQGAIDGIRNTLGVDDQSKK